MKEHYSIDDLKSLVLGEVDLLRKGGWCLDVEAFDTGCVIVSYYLLKDGHTKLVQLAKQTSDGKHEILKITSTDSGETDLTYNLYEEQDPGGIYTLKKTASVDPHR